LSLNTSIKKKPYYIIVLANKAKLKKNIISNIEEQNIIKEKRVKERLKAYAGFLTNVIKDKSLPAQRAAFNIGLTFYQKLYRD
jgi:ribosome-binding protein aMBF1 (putative translation factor)